MNVKTALIALGVLLILGGGYWFFIKDDNSAANDAANMAYNQEPSSINQLLAANQNQYCTYTQTDDSGNNSSGSVYLSMGRMSGDFTVDTPVQDAMMSHVINDGQYQYSWQEGSGQGFKIAIDALADSSADDSSAQSQSVDKDKYYDFNCQDWSVDEARFTPPSSVEFTDYTQQLQEAQQVQQDAADMQQAACDQITNQTARDACEAAL